MEQISYQAGEYWGREYFLAIRGDPDTQAPDDFSVTLYYADESRDERVVVVRVDTDHGYTHIDKKFLENEPKEGVSFTLWESVEHVSNNWLEYARQHREKEQG